MSKTVLITGATGKQGGSVVTALLKAKADFEILAVTRDASIFWWSAEAPGKVLEHQTSRRKPR